MYLIKRVQAILVTSPAGAPVPRSSKRVYSLVREVFSSERVQELDKNIETSVRDSGARFAPGTPRVSAS